MVPNSYSILDEYYFVWAGRMQGQYRSATYVDMHWYTTVASIGHMYSVDLLGYGCDDIWYKIGMLKIFGDRKIPCMVGHWLCKTYAICLHGRLLSKQMKLTRVIGQRIIVGLHLLHSLQIRSFLSGSCIPSWYHAYVLSIPPVAWSACVYRSADHTLGFLVHSAW